MNRLVIITNYLFYPLTIPLKLTIVIHCPLLDLHYFVDSLDTLVPVHETGLLLFLGNAKFVDKQ